MAIKFISLIKKKRHAYKRYTMHSQVDYNWNSNICFWFFFNTSDKVLVHVFSSVYPKLDQTAPKVSDMDRCNKRQIESLSERGPVKLWPDSPQGETGIVSKITAKLQST